MQMNELLIWLLEMGVEAPVRGLFAQRMGGAASGMEAEKPGGTWWTGKDSSEGVWYEDCG